MILRTTEPATDQVLSSLRARNRSYRGGWLQASLLIGAQPAWFTAVNQRALANLAALDTNRTALSGIIPLSPKYRIHREANGASI